MESPSAIAIAISDNVKFEKEKAIARFNRLRRLMRLWQILQLAIASAAVSWCAQAVARTTAACLLDFSTCLFNHHVVFLIGNAIIVLLFMLCRQSDGGAPSDRRDFYDDYMKFSDAARALSPPVQSEDEAAAEIGGGDCDKQIVAVETQCDEVAAAIEEAARRIKKFQRNNSEILRSEIAVRPELRRSETEHRRKITSVEAEEMENLSSDEFRRTIDAFIDKHKDWIKGTAKLEGDESLQLKLREYY